MARQYKRDARGRFASGGGGGNRRPATKGFSTGRNRLTRDNSGRITSQGGNGATARGGRLRTAGGNLRARQVGKLSRRSTPSGAIRRKDVITARVSNGISKNIEQRNKTGINPSTAAGEGKASRVRRATERIAARNGKPKGKTRVGKVKPAAAAPRGYGRGVDAAKVERMIGRLRQDPVRKGGYNRVNSVKARNARDTRTRALDFLNKAGGLAVKKKGGRPENPKNLTRDQMINNIAAKIAKPTRRSTARTTSKDVERRQQVRADMRKAFKPTKAAYVHGRTPELNALPFTPGRIRRLPDSPARAKGQGGIYSYTKIRKRTKNDPMYGPNVVGGGSWIAKSVILHNSSTVRTRKAAASAQAARRAGVRKLRGTGQLGRPTSTIIRGKARQTTIGGGVATTYGRFQMRSRRR